MVHNFLLIDVLAYRKFTYHPTPSNKVFFLSLRMHICACVLSKRFDDQTMRFTLYSGFFFGML